VVRSIADGNRAAGDGGGADVFCSLPV
jgi:hypothetical protein